MSAEIWMTDAWLGRTPLSEGVGALTPAKEALAADMGAISAKLVNTGINCTVVERLSKAALSMGQGWVCEGTSALLWEVQPWLNGRSAEVAGRLSLWVRSYERRPAIQLK